MKRTASSERHIVAFNGADKLKGRPVYSEQAKPHENPPVSTGIWKPDVIGMQLQALHQALHNRSVRKMPEFLIVEDQAFSRKLLAGLLEQYYHCRMASNAQQAVQLYVEYAPDITFLDIELPDADGHTLASFFKKHDPESHIVMVTGNHCAKDVEMAKANNVQGFVVKPYNKQKIMSAVNVFMHTKRRKA